LRPELRFQLLDLLAERRLRHVQPFGRPAEVELLGQREEVTQLSRSQVKVPFHARNYTQKE
jgi:hypothetical protein